MDTQVMSAILDKIKQYQKIAIFRHVRPDGDAVGSTLGLREILRESFPEKHVVVTHSDRSDTVAFLGEEDAPCPDEFFADALGIVIDTATPERISNPQYALCRELIKIDHHINNSPYGDIAWVEDGASAACELIAALALAYPDELRVNRHAATCLYTGLVTDSGRFRFRSVSPDTLRYAAALLEIGVDTEIMYAHLYMKKYDELKFQSYVLRHMRLTPNGVAHVYISRAVQKKFGLTSEQVGLAVNAMEEIRGSLIWIAFIQANDSRDIRVRLRSRFVTINEIAERYRGGGHANACGATLHSKKEMSALLAEADARLADYKAGCDTWL